MKTKLFLPGLFFMIIGCNMTQQDDRKTDDTAAKSEIISESTGANESLETIWRNDYNHETQEFNLTQIRSVDSDNLTGETLEKIINTSWPEVQIKFIRTSNDTVFISIPHSQVLTQQMGTAGAENFMILTTFTFTELQGIKHVSFDFEEGDHAIPGVYNRNSWDKNKNQ